MLLHNFSFPVNEVRRKQWITNIQDFANQFELIPRGAKICSDHFDRSCYLIKPNGDRVLLDDANPTIFRVYVQRR